MEEAHLNCRSSWGGSLERVEYDIRCDVRRNTGHEEYDIRRSTSLCYVPLFSDCLVGQQTILDVMPGGILVTRNMMSDRCDTAWITGHEAVRGHWEGGGVNDLKRETSLFTRDDTGIVLFFIGRNLLFCITRHK